SVLPAAGNPPISGGDFSGPEDVGALGDDRAPLALIGGTDDPGAPGGTQDQSTGVPRASIGTPSSALVGEGALSNGLVGGPGDAHGPSSATGTLGVAFGVNHMLAFAPDQPGLSGLTSHGAEVHLVLTTLDGKPALIGYTGNDAGDHAAQVFVV